MAQSDLVFVCTERPRAQVTKDRALTFTCKAYSDGTQATVTSATITIKKPGGGDLATPVSAAAMTMSGNDMTYALAAGNADTLGVNYTATVAYVVSSTTYDGMFLFDVVRRPIPNVVIQADLVKHHSDLADILFSGESNFQDDIEGAYCDWYMAVWNKTKRPWLILHPEEMRNAVEHLALAKIFFQRVKQDGDRWDRFHKFHLEQYQNWFANFVPAYDEDSSGTIDGGSQEGHGGESERAIGQPGWRV